MKVIAINGSPRKDGNTAVALGKMAEVLIHAGIEVETIQVGHLNIRGCLHCGYCREAGGSNCAIKDDPVNEVAAKMRTADGFILASPTYYAGIAGTMKAFLDRVFFSSSRYFQYKVATAITTVRRAGGVDVVHQLHNYLHLAQTVTPPSQYWTVVYGAKEGEALQDGEGLQTVQRNAQAMAWLLKVIEAGKNTVPYPEDEKRIMTNFIR